MPFLGGGGGRNIRNLIIIIKHSHDIQSACHNSTGQASLKHSYIKSTA